MEPDNAGESFPYRGPIHLAAKGGGEQADADRTGVAAAIIEKNDGAAGKIDAAGSRLDGRVPRGLPGYFRKFERVWQLAGGGGRNCFDGRLRPGRARPGGATPACQASQFAKAFAAIEGVRGGVLLDYLQDHRSIAARFRFLEDPEEEDPGDTGATSRSHHAHAGKTGNVPSAVEVGKAAQALLVRAKRL